VYRWNIVNVIVAMLISHDRIFLLRSYSLFGVRHINIFIHNAITCIHADDKTFSCACNPTEYQGVDICASFSIYK